MARGNSSPNRSRSKSSSRSGITRSQSRRGRSPSPSRYGSHRYRRSQERRDSPWPRRKSTERQSQNRRSSSRNRNGSHEQTTKIRSFHATVDDCILTSISVPDERTEKRTKTPSPTRRSRSKSSSYSGKESRKSPRASSSHSRRERRKSPRASSSHSSRERKKSPGASSSHSRKERRKSPRTKTPSHRKSPETPLQRKHSPLQNRSYSQTMVTLLLSDEEIWEEDGIDMKPLRLNAAEKVSTLPKIGEIYSEVKADVKNIEKRLKCLSEKLEMLSINEANEIADAVILLKFLKKSNPEIEMAGQMAHKGVLLMLQAEVLSKKGKELLEQSKNKIKSTMS